MASYETTSGKWEYPSYTDPVAPTLSRYSLTCTMVNGKLYTFGGVSGLTTTNEAHVYDTVTGKWNALTSADGPSARRGHTATLLPDGRLVIIGGGLQQTDNTIIPLKDYRV